MCLNLITSTVESGISDRFDIEGYPSLYLLYGNKYYKFKGKREQEDLLKFIEGGYEDAEEQEIIPEIPTFTEKVMRFFPKTYRAFERALDILFFKIGFTDVPPSAKFVGIIGFICIPFISIFCCIKILDDGPAPTKPKPVKGNGSTGSTGTPTASVQKKKSKKMD